MIFRGDIYYANLNPVVGSEQNGLRPVLVIQNNKGNKHSPTVIVAPITSGKKKKHLPTHVVLPKTHQMPYLSMVLLEQIRAMDKQRLRGYVGHVDEDTMERVSKAIIVSLALPCRQEERKRTEPEGKRLCLCPACANQFYSSPDHVIRRAEGRQKKGDICEYCEVQPGFDFIVINRRKRLEDC